jgi:hypothetical protein
MVASGPIVTTSAPFRLKMLSMDMAATPALPASNMLDLAAEQRDELAPFDLIEWHPSHHEPGP